MTSKEYAEVCDILAGLQDEFVDEEERLVHLSREYSYRINELEEQIRDTKNNDDLDFKVFSPRNIDLGSSDKVKTMETEKTTLEREKVEADKQISYYTDKSDKLGKVLLILKKYAELNDEFSARVDENVRKFDPFAFIDEQSDDSDNNDRIVDETDVFSVNRRSSGNDIFDSLVAEEEVVEENIEENNVDDEFESDVSSGIPVENIRTVCHKVEFTEKIINDRLRAKIELKEVIADLHKLIDKYK